MRKKKDTRPHGVSPVGGKRGCLCPDNTYHKKCCDGSYRAQGIGVTVRIDDNP